MEPQRFKNSIFEPMWSRTTETLVLLRIPESLILIVDSGNGTGERVLVSVSAVRSFSTVDIIQLYSVIFHVKSRTEQPIFVIKTQDASLFTRCKPSWFLEKMLMRKLGMVRMPVKVFERALYVSSGCRFSRESAGALPR
jgi:hypothetical protein